MQQKLCTRNTMLFLENGQAYGAGVPLLLPFRCPRCGEHERFHSLAALRAHLEYSHTYQSKHDLSLPASRGYSLPDCMEDRRKVTTETQTTKDAGTDTHSTGRGEHKLRFTSDPPPLEQPDDAAADHSPSPEKTTTRGEELLSAPVASVGQRLEGMMRTANSSMERRLLRLSSELAQTDTALLCERAHSHHLAQERQEVLERERTLSRQVDAAVMVIATLRQQLSMSEHELERREQEVIAIQKFLEAAAQHEMCGKVRLRRFIEGLLRRIALAERLLEYYQSTPHEHYCTAHSVTPPAEVAPQRITKSRSTGEHLAHDEQQIHGCASGWGGPHASAEKLGGHQDWLQRRRSDGYEV